MWVLTTRHEEWYVPKRGPLWLRSLIGMTFFPYTAMNVSYPIIGSMLAPIVHWDRVLAIAVVYLLALGIAGHALDAKYSKGTKPWGSVLADRHLTIMVIASLVPALTIGLYYTVTVAPLLFLIGLVEIFFLFAYNMELRRGKFHTDCWFAISWAVLPLLAGYVIQTNSLTFIPLAVSVLAFLTAFVEISASRPYKNIRKGEDLKSLGVMAGPYERVLKSIVGLVVFTALLMVVHRLTA